MRRIDVERAVVAALLEESEHSTEGWLALRDLEQDLREGGRPDAKDLISESLVLLGHWRIAAVESRQVVSLPPGCTASVACGCTGNDERTYGVLAGSPSRVDPGLKRSRVR